MSGYRHPHTVDAVASHGAVYEFREVTVRYEAPAGWPGKTDWGLGASGGSVSADDDDGETFAIWLSKLAVTHDNGAVLKFGGMSIEEVRCLGEQLVAFADDRAPVPDDAPTTTDRQPSTPDNAPHCLCCNCGGIAPCGTFDALRRDGAPTVLRCPLCRWEHHYDDSSLGLRGGTRAEMEYERSELARDPVWTGIWGDGPGETPAAGDASAPRP